ncbi:MAG TPA: GGDEF domain-containing protein [Gemmataceae bacterium]|nr:GGDEF domain-containing protein [Gemmataceae bacterium]
MKRSERQLDIVAQLQACLTAEDAYKVIAQGLQQLLPTTSGKLYVRKEPGDFRVEAVESWGQCAQAEPAFQLHQCHALRLMKVVENAQTPVCQHVVLPRGGSSVCVPLMADSQASGLLYLESAAGTLTSRQRQLARNIARQSALALRNLQERKELKERATRDKLTGLYNRAFMDDSLEREVARAHREKSPVGLIMLDIDYFKRYNTDFTWVGGDALLRALGEFLAKQVRGGDVACRYGGEEFLLILPGASLKATRQRAQKLRKEVKELQVSYENKPLGAVSLSLGVAVFPKHGTNPKSVLHAVNAALSRAKAEGRDRVIVASSLQPA